MFMYFHDDWHLTHRHHYKKQTRFMDSRSRYNIGYHGRLHRNRLASRMVSSHNVIVGCVDVGFENAGYDSGKITPYA